MVPVKTFCKTARVPYGPGQNFLQNGLFVPYGPVPYGTGPLYIINQRQNRLRMIYDLFDFHVPVRKNHILK